MKIIWEEVLIGAAVFTIATALTSWGSRDFLKFGEGGYKSSYDKDKTFNAGASNGKIRVYFDTTDAVVNTETEVEIVMENLTGNTKSINSAGVVINYDKNIVQVVNEDSLRCGFLPERQVNTVNNNDGRAELSCSAEPNRQYSLVDGETKTLGLFKLKALSEGSFTLAFSKAQVIELIDNNNIVNHSDGGTDITFTVNP